MACIFCNWDVQTARAKREMYVWTCTKENLSCNLTCYNVQYVCIVFDWGNFYAERKFCFFAPTFLIPTVTVPSQIVAVCSLQPPCCILSWNNWQMCSLAVCAMIWFSCVARGGEGSQCDALTKLKLYGVVKNSGLVLHSCFSLKLLYLI